MEENTKICADSDRIDLQLKAIRGIIDILNGIAPQDRCNVISFVHQHVNADVSPYMSAGLGVLARQKQMANIR